MNRRALIRFFWNYEEAAVEFKDEPYLTYLFTANPALSDNGVDDVCNWIVS